ncbi:hypothetical protein WKI65_43415 [Streptomyces sp. MS1.AVA.3]|uniref:hypothetical protein n=1 Tax=Streptomyces decoyicus TaxID=249567 RepID=UPI0030C46C03
MTATATAPFINADVLEDSALLAALDNSSGMIDPPLDRGEPGGPRLVSMGLATVDEKGYHFLTEDGRASALALREQERLLIPDDVLNIILGLAGRATGKRTGWISGVTTFGQRPYIESVRLPHTDPQYFEDSLNRGATWVNIPTQVFNKLGGYAEREGTHIYFAPPFRPSFAPAVEPTVPGTPFTADRDKVSAMQHADAVWNDLCDESAGLRVGQIDAGGDRTVYMPPAARVFHHCSRDVRLDLDEHGRYRAEIVAGPDTGRTWTGHRADIAIKAMSRGLYGTHCAHDYGTGRDSCPGCDATSEEFEDRQGTLRGAMPGSLPSLTRS